MMKALPISVMLAAAIFAQVETSPEKANVTNPDQKKSIDATEGDAVLQSLKSLHRRIDVLENENAINSLQSGQIPAKIPLSDKQIYRPEGGSFRFSSGKQVPGAISNQNDLRKRLQQLEDLVEAQKKLITALKAELAECKQGNNQ